MWSWLYLQLLNLKLFLFIYLLPVSDITCSVQLSLRLFIGVCASAMFNSYFGLVIGVFDKLKKGDQVKRFCTSN